MDKQSVVDKAKSINEDYARLVSCMTEAQFSSAVKYKFKRDPLGIAEQQDDEAAWDSFKSLSDVVRDALMNW